MLLPRRQPGTRTPDAEQRRKDRRGGRSWIRRRGTSGPGWLPLRLLINRAARAAAVECDLVPVRDEAGLPLDLEHEVLHEFLVELYDGATLPAPGVVMHPLGGELVARVSLPKVFLANDAEL